MEVGAWMFGMNNNRYKDLGLRPFVYARSIGPWEATSAIYMFYYVCSLVSITGITWIQGSGVISLGNFQVLTLE